MSVTPGGTRAVRASVPGAAIAARLVQPEVELRASGVDLPSAVDVLEEQAGSPREPRVAKSTVRSSNPATGPANVDAAPGVSQAADPTYYLSRQLDVYPVLNTVLDLREGRQGGGDIAGHVLLLVMIDHHGSVDAVSVVESEPAGAFGDDARRAFLAARFRPALKDGRAVKARVLVRVSYGDRTQP